MGHVDARTSVGRGRPRWAAGPCGRVNARGAAPGAEPTPTQCRGSARKAPQPTGPRGAPSPCSPAKGASLTLSTRGARHSTDVRMTCQHVLTRTPPWETSSCGCNSIPKGQWGQTGWAGGGRPLGSTVGSPALRTGLGQVLGCRGRPQGVRQFFSCVHPGNTS